MFFPRFNGHQNLIKDEVSYAKVQQSKANYSGLIELDTLILGNTTHYRGEPEYKAYTTEFRSEVLVLTRKQDHTIFCYTN